MLRILRLFLAFFTVPVLLGSAISAESMPGRLQGTWRINRVLPTTNNACWGKERATPLVGSMLTYRDDTLRWRGGAVPLEDITTRTLTDNEFRKENGGETPASFAQLGIHAHAVLEVDLQHEDADITGATTEVPGDSVLLAGPNRIVVSACGVYFEATRAASGVRPVNFRR
ncbi:MAG: hypothetical protein ACRYFU_17980 [Janthinobacterium lividum]